ncbi:MAG TPA: MBL fold metallo-hydrolase [Candidatus Limnocylindrales bacterium]|nr:MBL fold metallo-hydrolase [Candidatus Limnocylindrales bacterium]
MRLTVLGTGTARPVPDTPASGVLVQTASTNVLFDIGSGVASKLEATIGALSLSGLVVGHYHADHWIDIAPLRYRFPWGEPPARPLPVRLPPFRWRDQVDRLALAIGEREGFFDIAFAIEPYESGVPFQIGDLTITPHPVGHYIPAWSMNIVGPGGTRIVYAGDMGPSESVVDLARGADLLILEATLESAAIDDARRGHLSTEEAIDHARRAGVPQALLVHYHSDRRAQIAALCEASGVPIRPATPLLSIEVGPATGEAPGPADQEIVKTG